MKIETLSTFPEMFDSVMNASIMRIAQEKGLLEFVAYDLRDWTHDKHRTTDDYPFGGGQGLVMKPEPIFEAYDSIVGAHAPDGTAGTANPGTPSDLSAADGAAVSTAKPFTIFLTPVGVPFSDEEATRLSKQDRLLFICGHYEGIDERVYSLADACYSIGDYVLSSGELASMVVIDAVVRKLEGVLGNDQSAQDESFAQGLLEYPQYTRPAQFRGMDVPEVLLSGNHAAIAKWRREESLMRTTRLRPDLLASADLSPEERAFLEKLSQ